MRVEPSISLNRQVTSSVGVAGESVMSVLEAWSVPWSVTLRLGQTAETAGEPTQDRERDLRMLGHDRLEVPRRECEAGRRSVGDDLGHARTPVEDRQLAEEVAGPDMGDGPPIADHADGPARHEEEPRPDLALPRDHVILREVDLHHPLRDHRDALGVD